MSTVVFKVSDTIASRDTSFVKVENLDHLCQPIFQEAGTNCQDVAIVFFICAAIVVVAMYGICKFFADRAKEREYQKGRETQKRNWDVEDKNRKELAEQKNREWSLEDQNRKKIDELMKKKLQLLNDLCYEQKEIKESVECAEKMIHDEGKDGKDGKDDREFKETKEVSKAVRVLKEYTSQEIKDYLAALTTDSSTTTE